MSASNRVILITGATGNNGAAVARALAQLDNTNLRLRLLVRDPSKLSDDVAKLGDVVKGDLSVPSTLEPALHGVDSLFLLAPMTLDSLDQIKNAVEVSKKVGVKFILNFSSIGSDLKSDIWLGRDHALQEQAVKDSGIPWSIIQPTYFMSNLVIFNSHTIKSDGKWFGSSGGDAVYSSIHVADTADVAAKIIANPKEHYSKTYSLTGPEVLSDNELAKLATSVWERSVEYVDLSSEEYLKAVKSSRVPDELASSLNGFEQLKRRGEAKDLTSTVENFLGRAGRTWKQYVQESKSQIV